MARFYTCESCKGKKIQQGPGRAMRVCPACKLAGGATQRPAAPWDAPAAPLEVPTDGANKPPKRLGKLEATVRADVAALVTGHPMGESLTELALYLARTLDSSSGLSALSAQTASVSKELRATLDALAGREVPSGESFEDLLSTPVRDEEEP